jgi:predicted site-specific integrase-resolvase
MLKNFTTSAGVPKLALTRKEAASALGISAVTIDRLTARGLLEPSRASRRPLFPVFEIERFLKATQRQPQAMCKTVCEPVAKHS